MDENVLRILSLLEEGRISAADAEKLISALQGEPSPAPAAEPEPEKRSVFAVFDKIRPPKIDLDELGASITRAATKLRSHVSTEELQTHIKAAGEAGAQLGATLSRRVKTWTEGEERAPEMREGQKPVTDTQVHELHLDDGAAVAITNPAGSVTLRSADDGLARITILRTAWGSSEAEAQASLEQIRVDLTATDGRMELRISVPEGYRHGTANVDASVPRGADSRVVARWGDVEASGLNGNVEAITANGKIAVRDLGGNVRAETGSGDVTVSEVRGAFTASTQGGAIRASNLGRDVTAHTASGTIDIADVGAGSIRCRSMSGSVKAENIGKAEPADLTIESISGEADVRHARGNLSIKTVSGKLSGTDIESGRLHANSVSGNLEIELAAPFSGTLQANSISGSVTLRLPTECDARIALSTSSGQVSSELHDDQPALVAGMWTGQLGTGAGNIVVHAVTGNIALRRNEAGDIVETQYAEEPHDA